MPFRPQQFTINRNSPLANGLVFAMLGRGASTSLAIDSSGYGNNGTLTNFDVPTSWTQTNGRNTLYVGGTNDIVIASTTIAPGPITGEDHTACAWINPSRVSVNQGVVGATGAATGGWLLALATGTNVVSYLLAGINYYNSTLAVTQDAWQFIAVSRSGTASTATAWHAINGALRSETITGIPTNTASLTRFVIGDRYGGSSIPYLGYVSDAMIWRRRPSDAEIAALADPSNVMLSVGGNPLIVPASTRRVIPWVSATPTIGFLSTWLSIPDVALPSVALPNVALAFRNQGMTIRWPWQNRRLRRTRGRR